MTPIMDRDHLQAWIKKFLGFTLPDCKVTDYADSTPLDFVYEVYRAIMDGKPLSIMALAGRDSAKTVGLSIIDLLSLLHDQRGAIHLGMTKKQATRARAYLDKYIHKNELLRPSIVKENSTEIVLNVDGEDVGLELLPCTPTAVQGGHSALLSYDELASSVVPSIVKGYRDSAGIPGSSTKGKPAVIVRITSRQAGYSLAEEEVKKAETHNVRVVKWTTIDSMQKCLDERSGTDMYPFYVNIIAGLKYRPEDFVQLSESDKEGFKLTTDTRSKCFECPLAIYCQGKAKNQTSDSPLLRQVDDVINKINSAGTHDWALSQIMSLQPSSEGLVYYEYDPRLHRPGWNKMWEVLTGTVPDHNVTREEFVAACRKRGCMFLAGIDWGWSNPSTCVVMALDDRDNIFILEAIGATYKSDPEWVAIIKNTICQKYPIDMFVPDSENKSGIKIMKDEDLPVVEVDKGPGTVKAGINIVKKFLRVPGTNNVAKLFVAPDIVSSVTDVDGLLEEFTKYHKEMDVTGKILDDKNPAKEFDHYMDAIRYPLWWRFGEAIGKVLWGNQPSATGTGTNIPSLDQIAVQQGIHFTDNRDEFKKMGNQDDDDDPNKPGGGKGGGGLQFVW